MGVKYAVTVTAWRSFTTSEGVSSEVPGAGQTPWIIMQNLNLDEDGDWIVDKYPDSDGKGSEDVVVGTKVTLTATVTAGGAADVAPTVTIVDSAGEEIELDDVTFDSETGTLKVEYRIQPSNGTYNVKITKPGCTYFELTEVPLANTVTSVDLNLLANKAKITLVIGDVNGDGRVTAMDVAIVIGNLNRTGEVTTGDLNGDGRITAMDVALVKGSLNASSTSIKWKGL